MDFFYVLFTKEIEVVDMDLVFHDVELPRMLVEDHNHLVKSFTTQEIWTAVNSMYPIKARGSGRYHAKFYPQHWQIVGSSISNMLLINKHVPLIVQNDYITPESMVNLCSISLWCTRYYPRYWLIILNLS